MSRSQIFTPINTNLRYCIDDLEATVTYYDSDGLPNDPVTVLTRAEAEEGGEEGGDEQQAQPSIRGFPTSRSPTRESRSTSRTTTPDSRVSPI